MIRSKQNRYSRLLTHKVTFYGPGEPVLNELNTWEPGEPGPITGYTDVEAFVDPLSTSEWYIAQQSGTQIDANIYLENVPNNLQGVTIERMDKPERYQIIGQPIDEGGQGEIYKLKVRKDGEPNGV